MTGFEVRPIGHVSSTLTSLADAPRQADEGAPEAWLVLEDPYAAALTGIEPGHDLVVITWLDRADRDTLAVHPRGETDRPLTGVFATRSPSRPNPIGLHDVQVVEVSGTRIRVRALEALDGTPILDVKPVLTPER
ncbi:tRNA (N6-threonylcarbamoyladenosine(37)-N6)-methyltransferase TrmO [Nocardioides marmorisolisilvae]|uniref:tRNA (N6-threonylcarbamoyladenosine(37)-N6)-methyltransferase TrmO n=1 Tax=Nocardioides marmorisolisilvae TaxID=1542737 RepID=A0A3N0DUK8_9ACTN|nr:tRNA (N6-threonylcarbamoyladenosine(37)-N6)-methyltransferase TrmO [Nocardioides marmorisolisilvae]RNL79324.1 tRNA (N6-threonylcarbamoyladenosine(37)-N6)-methyltransferase TrmO [Nocardioides marmorisolisilvae]